jgi:hypothetical protein
MSEQDPENTGNTAQDPARDREGSPLRGSLETNADGADLHDMGGATGPADDSARATEPPEPAPRDDDGP